MDTPKIPYTYTVNNSSEVTSVTIGGTTYTTINGFSTVTTATIGGTTYTTGYGNRQANYTKLSRYLPPNNTLTFHRQHIEELVNAIILARLDGAL